tara:strand:+ start:7445 stop:10069 length:2625 start_codon:yes stop_codon:yes gene_type:complete
MNKYTVYYIIVCIFSALAFTDPYKQLDIDFLKDKKKSIVKDKIPVIKKKKGDLPAYIDVIKNYEKIEGVFDFYWDYNQNKLLLSLKPEDFQKSFMQNITRQSGDAYYYGGPSMLYEFPFIFKQIGKKIQLIHINVLFRADDDRAISKAVQNDFSNSIISTAQILSSPDEETGSILVDANKLFIRDIGYVSQHGSGRYVFDYKNSSFIDIKSFPYNAELEISAQYKSNKFTSSYTLPNSRSMEIKYYISISNIIDNDYKPREVDDRIGYFSTIFQDYTNTLQETQYVRYINRWNLVKKDPYAKISEPVTPIVYWIENTVPEEFRGAIRDGIEGWNLAFEKIGFKNAIIAKQMPDDADWDPADSRYSTVRWFIQPGSGYAVGPSRANPYTGEIYDADVRISADFVKGFYEEFEEFVTPVLDDEAISMWEENDHKHHHKSCNYSKHLKQEMASGWHNLINQNLISGNKEELMDYIYKGLVDLVLHEVGHTLGLRHNFKASSIYSIDQLSDKSFTEKYGISGSVMDYHPVCLLDKGNTLFQTKPGPYDLWAIEYGYTQFNDENEKINLDEIAGNSNHPLLAYNTDEDTFGRSSRGIDPLSGVWDMSSDPIQYYKIELEHTKQLWNNLLDKFEYDGQRYQKIRSVFSQGIGEYINAGISASKFVGGVYFHRNHVGDEGQKPPFVVVEVEKQKAAIEFLNDYFFDKNAFYFNPELLNKLSPERHEDFRDSAWRLDRNDYPIHSVVQRIQMYALYSLFHPRRLARIHDNEVKVDSDEYLTMDELFDSITKVIWQELYTVENINSYKRELQKMQINMFSQMIFSNIEFSSDVVSLARYNLKNILKDIYSAIGNNDFDSYSKSHLQNSAEMIEAILSAEIQIN